MRYSRFGSDGLPEHRRVTSQPVAAEPGLVVEDVQSGYVGEIISVERMAGDFCAIVEDRFGNRRSFPLGPGFWIDGKPVTLYRPKTEAAPARVRTASGSVKVADAPAKVAKASRIYVEGKHDAELVEKVWGDDLRVEGVVVEFLGGIDDLPAIVREFRPAPGRRLGVLADHMIDGSKEWRLREQALAEVRSEHVLVIGHPFIDIWEAVKPAAVGIDDWPAVPKSEDWKTGVLARIGWPNRTQTDIADAWRRILGSVHSFTDLDPALVGRVEELIDFVTAVE